MRVITKNEFLKRLQNDRGLEPDYPKEQLPEKEIARLTAGVEIEKDNVPDVGDDAVNKAQKLANEIKKDTENTITSDKISSKTDKGKKYFDVDVKSKATVKGIKLKGHKGLEITGFKCVIETDTNAAKYNKCEVFRGNETDNWNVWGKYTGSLKSPVNKDNKARFEFYLRGKNLTVTYWKGYKYQDVAKKMAVRAIDILNEALS